MIKCIFLSNFDEIWIFFSTIFEKYPKIGLDDIPYDGRRVVRCGRTDRHTWRSQKSLFEVLRTRLKAIFFQPRIEHGISCRSAWLSDGLLLDYNEQCVSSAGKYLDITYSLTHSMVQSPSWAANWFAASQEIPHISRNPKAHYRTYKRPPTVPILGQPNPVHIPTSHLLEIQPNIIYPSSPRSPQWSPSLRFGHHYCP